MDPLQNITSVGLIGLGAMGKPMAKNLARKLPEHINLQVYDVFPAAGNELCSSYPGKVYQAANPADLASKSSIILTMLPEGSDVHSVFVSGPNAISSVDLTNKLLLDCSTVDTTNTLAVKDHISEHHPTASFYDAPVSGGSIGAERATLTFYLGCHASDPNLPLITAILRYVGNEKAFIPCGGPSMGVVAKTSNNYISGLLGIIVSEAMDMGIRGGMDPRLLAQVIKSGGGQNTVAERWNPVPGVVPTAPSSNGYKPGFRVNLMRKDIGLAVELAKKGGCRNVFGQQAHDIFLKMEQMDEYKDLDSKAVYRYLGGIEDWKKMFPDV